MSDIDDLRDKLALCLDRRDRVEIVDALMPVVSEALADAWDDGVEYAGGGTPMDLKANPWRDEPNKGDNA